MSEGAAREHNRRMYSPEKTKARERGRGPPTTTNEKIKKKEGNTSLRLHEILVAYALPILLP
jgi:hypothetical protein